MSLKTERFESHILYVPDDFTDEEIERGNILAVHVLDRGMNICKRCGRAEVELFEEWCQSRRQ